MAPSPVARRVALGGAAVAAVVLLAAHAELPTHFARSSRPGVSAAPPPHPLVWSGDAEKKKSNKGCGKCVARKCYAGAKCASSWGYEDPRGTDRAYCLCACCGLQCGLKRGCPVRPSVPAQPSYPVARPVANLTGDGLDTLDGVRGLAFCEWQGRSYALLTSMLDHALHVANIEDPARPLLQGTARHGEHGFQLESPSGLETMEIRGTPHALVASFTGDGLQIIRLDPPFEPHATAWAHQGDGGFDLLEGAHSVAAGTIADRAVAFVSAYRGGGVQVVDVGNPGAPRALAAARFLGGPQALALTHVDDATGRAADSGAPSWVLLVCLYNGDAVQLLDVSDPERPQLLPRLSDGAGGYQALGAPSSASFIRTAAGLLALVTSETAGRAAGAPGGGLQVVDLANPARPRPVSAVALERGSKPAFAMLGGASSVAALAHGNCTLALVAGYDANGLQLVDLSTPSAPKDAGGLAHGAAGALLESPLAVRLVRVADIPYVFVAASKDDAVEVVRLNTSSALLSACEA